MMMRTTKPMSGILPSLLLALVVGCSGEPPEAPTGSKIFATPEAAASALFDAIDRDDKQAVVSIFGREYESRLVTADWEANREERQRIAAAGREKLAIDDQDGVVTLVLGDEVLTPDSSRFWDASHYAEGRPQESFDKQPVRNWLDELGWDRKPPAPELTEEVV